MLKIRPLSGPLADRRFRLFWSGQSLSAIGDALLPVALALAVIKATGSASDLGLVLAATAIPRLLLMLVGGVWADRLPRQLVMLVADLINMLAQLAMGAELLSGTFRIGHLIALSACSGVASAFFTPASGALVPATVEASQLARANALMGISQQSASVIGPALATGIVYSAGPGWVMIANAITYALSVTTLAFLRVRADSGKRASFWAELGEGWHEIRRHRWYWTNVLSHAAWNLARATYQILGPLIAVRELGGDIAWGVIAQGAVIGALAGALIAVRIKVRYPLVIANLGLSLGGLPLLLLAIPAPAVLVSFSAGLMYAGLTTMQVLWNTTIYEHIPARKLSRVVSYDWLVSLGLNPLGLALAGPVSQKVGLAGTLIGAAVLVTGSNLAVLAIPEVRNLTARSLNSHTPAGAAEPTGTGPAEGEGASPPTVIAPAALTAPHAVEEGARQSVGGTSADSPGR